MYSSLTSTSNPFQFMFSSLQDLCLNFPSFEKQGVNNGAGLVDEGMYKLNNFKPEGERNPFSLIFEIYK